MLAKLDRNLEKIIPKVYMYKPEAGLSTRVACFLPNIFGWKFQKLSCSNGNAFFNLGKEPHYQSLQTCNLIGSSKKVMRWCYDSTRQQNGHSNFVQKEQQFLFQLVGMQKEEYLRRFTFCSRKFLAYTCAIYILTG